MSGKRSITQQRGEVLENWRVRFVYYGFHNETDEIKGEWVNLAAAVQTGIVPNDDRRLILRIKRVEFDKP